MRYVGEMISQMMAWEWMNSVCLLDPNVKIHRNEGEGNERLGHTILYDTLVDMTNDIVMIYHAIMYGI